MLEQVVCDKVEGTGKNAYVAGYRVGGKTGTSTDTVQEAKTGRKEYIVSFIGIAPMDDPQICIYVVLDRINNKKQDEAVRACEVAKNILTEVLPYMNIYMTEPVTDAERGELEKLGLYDTNDRSKAEESQDETQE
jgi:stage V sporulation protein D (sporulation-specific penicillin-binding protein)